MLALSHHLDSLSRPRVGRIHRSGSLASLDTADPLGQYQVESSCTRLRWNQEYSLGLYEDESGLDS